jgi:hypothetical protein
MIAHDIAASLTGTLFGNILHRDADPAGYAYYLTELEAGRMTVCDIVEEFFVSEEFSEKFVVNQSPNELGKYLFLSVWSRGNASFQTQKDIVVSLVKNGLPETVRKLVRDVAYHDRFGDLGVPSYNDEVIRSKTSRK